MLRPKPTEPEEEGPEEEGELEPLSQEEFESLSPEEKLLRAIFGQAPIEKGTRKAKRVSPPPPQTGSKLTAQAQPERVTMRFGFAQQMVPADLKERVVPTLEAVAQLDTALSNVLGEPRSDVLTIQRIHYGSPMDVELAQVSVPTVAVLNALAQNEDLGAEDVARLQELQVQLVQAQVENARLRNQEQILKNRKLETEIDSLRMQQLVTMFERLFSNVSEPMRLAIIAQNFPELKLLMPPNIQLLFNTESPGA